MLAMGGVAEAVGTAPHGRALWGCTPSTYVFAGSRSSSTCIFRFILKMRGENRLKFSLCKFPLTPPSKGAWHPSSTGGSMG